MHTNNGDSEGKKMIEDFGAAIRHFADAIAPDVVPKARVEFVTLRYAKVLGTDDTLLIEIELNDKAVPPVAIIRLCDLPELACQTLAFVLQHSLKITPHFLPPNLSKVP